MQSLTTCLMFEGSANDAIALYTSLFVGSEIVTISRYGAEAPGPPGTVMFAIVSLGGQHVMVMDSPAPHQFTFTPATSLFVTCESAEEVDRLYTALSSGGSVMMPLDAYPFSRRYAWVGDKFGVSWQLSLPLDQQPRPDPTRPA